MYNKDELSLLPVDSHNVTKNQTGHRMHVEGPQMWQINRWSTIAFRICMVCVVWYVWYGMYGMVCMVWYATIDCFARKIDFVQKNTSFSPILVDTNLSF